MPSLQPYHTFGLSAQCQKISTFKDEEQFFRAQSQYSTNWILGGGSNTLFLKDYDGQVLLNCMTGIEHKDTLHHHIIRVAGGENWHQFVSTCLQRGWYGLENLALIPGTVGASPIQNIGAYGIEVGKYIALVEGVDINTKKRFQFRQDECEFAYRDSIFKRKLAASLLITHVTFALPKDYQPVVTYGELAALESLHAQAIYDTVIAVRKRKLPDPKELGNSGSFFKNPVIQTSDYLKLQTKYDKVPGYTLSDTEVKVPAAWLIDTLGFKGKSIGGVRCHPNQPLVLTNIAQATGQDVIDLASAIIAKVLAKFAIVLEPEVRLVGRNGLVTL
jgi:UDP-N-acetylmuramate dehydrogenase